MKKQVLQNKTDERLENIQFVLQTFWDDMPKGQQKQRLKNEVIKQALDFYGVEYEV